MNKVLSFRSPIIKEGIQSPFYIKQMYDNAKYSGKDLGGNEWYLNTLLSEWKGFRGGDLRNNKVDFDLQNDTHKRLALTVCTPLAMVLNRAGSYFSNGRIYVQDKDGNEPIGGDAEKIRQLLKKPNLFQSGKQFAKQIESTIKLFGFCPIFTLRSTSKAIPQSMIIIPPELFHQETTGRIWMQTEMSEVVKKTYIEWGGDQLELEQEDYFIIVDSEIIINTSTSTIGYQSVSDSLSHSVNNWMAQIIGRGTLIKHGGPKGIIYNDDKSEFQNAALTKNEKEELNNAFKKKYGIVNKLFSIWVTQKRVGWLPLSSDSKQLMLHEEDVASRDLISNAIGLDPSIFSAESKYDNKDAAKRSAYQYLIIPDSENYTETLTNAICPENLIIKMDYSHIACLQDDKLAESATIKNLSDSLIPMYKDGLISKLEARIELARYMDINPKDEINE